MIAPKGEGETCACAVEALAERARRGDARALEQLFALIWPRVRAYLVRLTKRRPGAIRDVEDATQTTCLVMLGRLTRWPGKRLLHQSAVIGRHELARLYKVRQRRVKTLCLSDLSLETIQSLTLTVANADLDPAHIAQEQEQAGLIMAAMHGLTPRDWRILWTVFAEGQSNRQCSRLLDVDEATVRRVIREGLATLRRLLAACR